MLGGRDGLSLPAVKTPTPVSCFIGAKTSFGSQRCGDSTKPPLPQRLEGLQGIRAGKWDPLRKYFATPGRHGDGAGCLPCPTWNILDNRASWMGRHLLGTAVKPQDRFRCHGCWRKDARVGGLWGMELRDTAQPPPAPPEHRIPPSASCIPHVSSAELDISWSSPFA